VVLVARPRSEKARQKALDAAIGLVAESGVGGFSVEEVTRRSGVAKTTIYRNWTTSQDLLFDALNETLEPEPEPDTGSLSTDMRAFVEYLMGMDDETRLGHRQMFAGMFAASTTDERSDDLFRRMLAYRTSPVGIILERAQARGEIGPDVDLALAADLLTGPVMVRVFLRGETFSETEFNDLMTWAMRALAVDNG
jgi:AcrR family transcriptional regulator